MHEVDQPPFKERSISTLGQTKASLKQSLLEKESPEIQSEKEKPVSVKPTMHKLHSMPIAHRNTTSRNVKSQKSDLKAPLSAKLTSSTKNLYEQFKKSGYP